MPGMPPAASSGSPEPQINLAAAAAAAAGGSIAAAAPDSWADLHFSGPQADFQAPAQLGLAGTHPRTITTAYTLPQQGPKHPPLAESPFQISGLAAMLAPAQHPDHNKPSSSTAGARESADKKAVSSSHQHPMSLRKRSAGLRAALGVDSLPEPDSPAPPPASPPAGSPGGSSRQAAEGVHAAGEHPQQHPQQQQQQQQQPGAKKKQSPGSNRKAAGGPKRGRDALEEEEDDLDLSEGEGTTATTTEAPSPHQAKRVGRPPAYAGTPEDEHLTEEERRRLRRRIANRESARRVRIKRQEQMDEMQLKLTALTQQNARLLQHTAALEQQRQLLMGQVGMLRDKFADKATEAAQLRSQLEQLTRALQVQGGGGNGNGNGSAPGASPSREGPAECHQQNSGNLAPNGTASSLPSVATLLGAAPSLPPPPTPDANGMLPTPGSLLNASVFAQPAGSGVFPSTGMMFMGGASGGFGPLSGQYGFPGLQGMGPNLSGGMAPLAHTSSSMGMGQGLAPPSCMPMVSMGMPPPPPRSEQAYEVTVTTSAPQGDVGPGCKLSEQGKMPSISFFLAQ